MGEPKQCEDAMAQKEAEAAMAVAAAADADDRAREGVVQDASVPAYPVLPAVPVVPDIPNNNSLVVVGARSTEKKLFDAYLLGFPLGFLGLHHFYLRRTGFGVLYIFTFGLLGCGWIVDLFRMPWLVREANKKKNQLEYEEWNLCDAYVVWFPFGLIGFHHYYLGRTCWGFLYTCTLGIFGLGWLVDAFRMPSLIQNAKKKGRGHPPGKHRTLCEAYLWTLPPFGLLGVQHHYLGRHVMGLYYMLTLGGCGLGWLLDWCRLWYVVKRVNAEREDPINCKGLKYVDDAYLLAFPFGFLGLHHFYLNRPGWGFIYFFTFGLFGIGWLMDLCRMPCLVSDANQRIKDENMTFVASMQGTLGFNRDGQWLGIHAVHVIPPPQQHHGVSGVPYPTTLSATQLPVQTDLSQPSMEPPSYDMAMRQSTSLEPPPPADFSYHNQGFLGQPEILPSKEFV